MTATPQPPFAARPASSAIEEMAAFAPRFDAQGLIPAIATDAETGDVLMFAFMNAEALLATIETRQAHFYSRSRGRLWRKGEDSGNTLEVLELRTDCDQDVVWMKVRMAGRGAACHTGRRSCFYRAVPLGPGAATPLPLQPVEAARTFDPDEVYGAAGTGDKPPHR